MKQEWTFTAETTTPASARRTIAEACRKLPRELLEVVTLLTSEVVTNAVRYGSGRITLLLEETREALRVSVRDSASALPQRREPDSDATRGRGLLLLEAFAHRWGIDVEQGVSGKTVWFQLRKPGGMPNDALCV